MSNLNASYALPYALEVERIQRQRELDQRPCLTCGGDPLRPDYTHPGQPCHAAWPREKGDER